jgi:glutathione-regulated potassium-efflux system ancillary protein KefG
MAHVLVLFAHPALEKSRVNRALVETVPALAGRLPRLTFHDLYEAYPDFGVDVAREQALLAAHDVVVLHHPFYWYSAPPLVKQWEDLVLEHGWAYGARGRMLDGKRLLSVVTLGGGASAYRPEGYNRFTVRQLLAPIEQMARLCRMQYLPPWVVYGTHRMQGAEVARAARRYAALLTRLHDDRLDLAALAGEELCNGLLDPVLDADAPAGDAAVGDAAVAP